MVVLDDYFYNIEKRRMHCMECQVERIRLHNLGDVWDKLYEGAKLTFVRDKNNKSDKYAIAVVLADVDFILGYVPRTVNKQLALMLDIGLTFECELCQVIGHKPYKGCLKMKIYM